VALFSNGCIVGRKPTKRVNLDDLKDDAEEEVCHSFTSLRALLLISLFLLHRKSQRHPKLAHKLWMKTTM